MKKKRGFKPLFVLMFFVIPAIIYALAWIRPDVGEYELVISVLFIMLLPLYFFFVWYYRKDFGRIRQFAPATGASQPSHLMCPKCNGALRTTVGNFPPLYFCKKCGYHGPIGLEPEKQKKS